MRGENTVGIFSLFSKNSSAPRTDIIWMTEHAMLNNCIKFISENKADKYIAWFEDTYEKFNRFFNDENNMNISITMARSLQPYHIDGKNLIFLEHYPLYSKEAFLLTGNKPGKIIFLNSLDDTIFQLFAGNIKKLITALGLGENEYMEHQLISKSIVKAQKRLDKKVKDDFYVRSGEDWLNQYRIYCGRIPL